MIMLTFLFEYQISFRASAWSAAGDRLILLNKDAVRDTKVWASENFAYRLLRNHPPSAYNLALGSIATHLTKMIQDALPHYWAITNCRWDAERLLRDHGSIADVAFMSLLSVLLLSHPLLTNVISLINSLINQLINADSQRVVCIYLWLIIHIAITSLANCMITTLQQRHNEMTNLILDYTISSFTWLID